MSLTPTERAARIHEGIKKTFLSRFGTQEQWMVVTGSPIEFNRAWRASLGLPIDVTPPPEGWRNIDPSTGERLGD